MSVLLPVRDGERFLEEALISVLHQTHRDLELLVVDDASTDRTPDLLRSWRARDPRLRVITNVSSMGVAGALNRGLAEAQGPLVARMDADDICHPRRLASQVAVMEARPDVGVCGTGTTHVDARGRRLPSMLTTVPRHPHGVRVCTAVSTPLAHPTIVMRTELLRTRGGYDERALLEDLDLWLRCADLDMVNLSEPLLRYRVHGSNTTSGARRGGAQQLAGRLSSHLEVVLGADAPVGVCRLLLDPRAAPEALDEEVEAALDVLDRLSELGGPDQVAVLDRALSTASVLVGSRLRAGLRPPTLARRRHLRSDAVARRAARGAWVSGRRRIALQRSLTR